MVHTVGPHFLKWYIQQTLITNTRSNFIYNKGPLAPLPHSHATTLSAINSHSLHAELSLDYSTHPLLFSELRTSPRVLAT
jgi:hypothetical protein